MEGVIFTSSSIRDFLVKNHGYPKSKHEYDEYKKKIIADIYGYAKENNFKVSIMRNVFELNKKHLERDNIYLTILKYKEIITNPKNCDNYDIYSNIVIIHKQVIYTAILNSKVNVLNFLKISDNFICCVCNDNKNLRTCNKCIYSVCYSCVQQMIKNNQLFCPICKSTS